MICRADGYKWYTRAPFPRALPSATAVAWPGSFTPVKAVYIPKVAPAHHKQSMLLAMRIAKLMVKPSFFGPSQYKTRGSRRGRGRGGGKAAYSITISRYPYDRATRSMP